MAVAEAINGKIHDLDDLEKTHNIRINKNLKKGKYNVDLETVLINSDSTTDQKPCVIVFMYTV